MSFEAFRIHQQKKDVRAGFEQLELDDLTEGDVVIKVHYSDINYKDALAATGTARILRVDSLNGGIDLSGVVTHSESDRFNVGDQVLVCGALLSETVDGGYSEYARISSDSIVPLPEGLTLYESMALGTAGFTAALAMIRLEENGQDPSNGPMIVTGATGGVGSIAIEMLASKGYDVVAMTGKSDQHDYLRELGARDFVDRGSLNLGSRPLEKALWGGAVDNVGGAVLGWLTRTVRSWGSIASVGNAGGIKLETTVFPLILRGVSLLGINSIEMSNELRNRAWSRLATDLKPAHLDMIASQTIDLVELPEAFGAYIDGSVTGRTVVRIGD